MERASSHIGKAFLAAWDRFIVAKARKAKPMRIGIFYLSHSPGDGRQPVQLPLGGTVYVRVFDMIAKSLEEALDFAAPRDGEMVMNTHPLPDAAKGQARKYFIQKDGRRIFRPPAGSHGESNYLDALKASGNKERTTTETPNFDGTNS